MFLLRWWTNGVVIVIDAIISVLCISYLALARIIVRFMCCMVRHVLCASLFGCSAVGHRCRLLGVASIFLYIFWECVYMSIVSLVFHCAATAFWTNGMRFAPRCHKRTENRSAPNKTSSHSPKWSIPAPSIFIVRTLYANVNYFLL